MVAAYSPEAKAEIMNHVLVEVASGRFVSRVLREDDGMPAASQFWKWHLEDEDYQEKLGRAREAGVEALLDEVTDIVDDATDDAFIDYVGKGEDKEPVAKINGSAIRRASLRAEYRVKLAQMMKPRKYGNKLDLTSDGKELKPGAVNQTKIDALIAVGVSRALKAREQQALPAPEENENE